MKKLLFCMAIPVFLLGSSSAFADSCTQSGVIEVVGHAKVDVMPDIAVLSYSARDENKDSVKARNSVEKKITSLYDKALSLGVKKEQIISGSITLYPKYHYTDKSKRVFDGYFCSRDIVFKIDDFSLIEKITTAAVDSGIGDINGFGYEIKDTTAIKKEADTKAIADARDQAQRLADGFGVKIKKACSLKFEDNNSNGFYPKNRAAVSLMAVKAEAAPAATEYMPEKQSVESNVYATFSIE